MDRHRNAASKKNVSFLWMSKYFMKIVQCDRLGDQRFRIVIGDFHKSASENEDVWGRFDVLFLPSFVNFLGIFPQDLRRRHQLVEVGDAVRWSW